jgi:predicted nucleic acid-binding protein
VEPVLLDASFLIDLEREIESGRAGPAMAWLRANRSLPDRPLIVSCVSVAEFLEGFEDERRGLHFILRFVPQTLGFKQARRCAEVQRRARRRGRRFGENDAWQIAFADCAGAAIVARDRRAFDQLGPRCEQYAARS